MTCDQQGPRPALHLVHTLSRLLLWVKEELEAKRISSWVEVYFLLLPFFFFFPFSEPGALLAKELNYSELGFLPVWV